MPTVTIHAPCRLHFGLFSFGRGAPQYGGVGVMLDQPRLSLRISPSDQLQFHGHHAPRLETFVTRWHDFEARPTTPMRLEVLDAPREHQGLGLGTALGMSVAAGLRRFYGLDDAEAATLAESVGRGRRSAVGAYGFCLGGFIAEAGRPAEAEAESAPLSPLEKRLRSPESWRFVLIQPPESPGISGESEASAFATLPAVPATTRRQLVNTAHQRLLPAIESENFHDFADALYDFGRLAGECFSSIQGGPYRGPQVTEIVGHVRRWGHLGVGQSSWGPTIYVAAANPENASQLASQLEQWRPELQVTIAAVCNGGTRCDVGPELG